MADTPGDATTLYEEKREEMSRSNGHHVNVAEAEAQFNALSRQLSKRSQVANSQSSDSTADGNDLEKASPDDERRFDLREYLTSSNDANQQAGIKHKHVGVIWEDLQVEVAGGLNSKYVEHWVAQCLAFSLVRYYGYGALSRHYCLLKPSATRAILHKSSGVLKPGEMCLVLGCPGAGCTTFLKTIANERDGYANVSGNVLYAGIDAAEMAKYYKGEVVYNQEGECLAFCKAAYIMILALEDDIHIATLTVAQTLAFALSTKTPGPNGRIPGVTRKEFNDEVLDTLLKMLNISHTRQTLVGDEFVRGVSGGERKRVSIAEMMATRARVQCWDNSTRGLDASTALDFVKSLRVMTDVLGQTTFVTLYQAGEGIYDLFDKVLVLDQGRQVFLGPPSEARAYFENLGYNPLPRQSTADYLTGCTDPNERQFAPGKSVNDTPSSPEALETAYLYSTYASDNDDAKEKYKLLMETEKLTRRLSELPSQQTRRKVFPRRALPHENSRPIPTSHQLYSFVGSCACYRWRIFGQPPTSAGAFTRGSVIFAALLNTCLDAFGEMPMQMLGRPILRKQTSYSMYRPSAIALANTLADLPFSATRVLLYNIIVYFMVGLHRSAGAFFTFHLFNYIAYLTMQGFFRTFGLICFNFDSAFRLAVFFIPNFIQYTGYMIPVDSMKRWLFWIYYINPISYGLHGERIYENFVDMRWVIRYSKERADLTKYPNELGPNQACTLFGSQSGSNIISGRDYLAVGYGLDVNDLWRRCLPVIIGFFLAFQVTQLLALEYFPQFGFNMSINIFTKENDETKKLNAALRERKVLRESSPKDDGDAMDKEKKQAVVAGKKSFTWERMNYHVPSPSGPLRLLHDVYGYVKPGTLTALMGASGAGKTTCLDVLAQRKNIGVVSGDILVAGRPLDFDFARGTAYAEQMDVHEGTATVREAMRFSAYLRQPASVSKEEKDHYVEEMIELLELQDLTEAMVFSLGVEARKRLTIGVELASKPELLLFLDEPTSGLDAQSAWNLVRFLRKLADQGQAILCTIHQPSSLLFESFDRLLLLERGGETVYFGDIGQDSRVIREYFARNGAQCPSNVNPAEFMLEAIGAGVTPRIGDRDWKDIWLDSPEFQKVTEEIDVIKKEALALPVPDKSSTNATSFLYQLGIVVKRNSTALWRSPDYTFSRLFVTGFISLFISLSFLQLGNSLRDLQFRLFGMFWVVVLPAIVMTQIEPLFLMNRRIFVREASSRIYSPYVFALGQLIGEIPYSIICSIVYWVFMVYPMGFGKGSAGINGTGFQLLVIMFMMLFGVSLGQLVAALSPSVQRRKVAVLFNPFLGLVLATFCGVTIPYPTMARFWRSWLYQLVPYTRSLAAMVSTELHGLVIRCKSDEFAVFDPPSGQTCQQWGQDFVNTVGGYIDNLNDTTACRYCQYSIGDEFYTPLNISFSNRWRDAFILFSFVVFNLIVTIIASRFLRYAKR
ncbi:pleiotropic drug resistance ABC transporter [Cyathus striatus]|nr:pleiotropic drug resistance ABC transporter [Cyathus striatus]